MCGRYRIKSPFRVIRDLLDGKLAGCDLDIVPSYNVAPSQTLPIIRLEGDKPTLSLAQWGLIPSWTKGKPKLAPINAKCETAATSGMFRSAMASRRCLVPADGFYEWQGPRPAKKPFFIHRKDDQLFAFAGLWEIWRPAPDAEPVETFTILTTEPNELMKPIHNRMPVILAKEDFEKWLNKNNKASDVSNLLKPFPADQFEAYPVSPKVNSPQNNSSDLCEPMNSSDGAPEQTATLWEIAGNRPHSNPKIEN